MVKEARPETGAGAFGWTQDQVYQLKARVAQMEQQLEQLRTVAMETGERQRVTEASLDYAIKGPVEAARLQEEINQAAGLIVQLQDQQAETRERLEALGRRRHEEGSRDQNDWVEVVRRVEQIERQIGRWDDRQAGVDEVGKRFQVELSVVRQQLQRIEQQIGETEGKAARGLEGATRAEHTLTEVEASILALQREDETIAERARVAVDVGHRLETTLGEHLEELRRLELLAERIELHRAERQRLEDRARRLDEEMEELRGRVDRADHTQGQLSSNQQGLASRLEALQEQVDEQRTALIDQFRKLTGSQQRTKRRQIQELEREVREMKGYVAKLTDE